MKKILISLILLVGIILPVNAKEVEIEGHGSALLTGYNIKEVRNMQDYKMDKKAKNSNLEVLQTQQIKEATRQAETRKKQDKKLNATVRQAVITEAQQKALENGIKVLIDMTYGAGASKNPKIVSNFDTIVSQASTYVVDSNYSGELKDNEYMSTVKMIVDQSKFKEKMSLLGFALNTQNVRAHSILVVLDEFFAPPSNLSQSTATKEVITYNKTKDEKKTDKEALKTASSNSAAYAGIYGKAGAQSKSGTTYGKFNEYTNKENEFFQYIKEYAPTTPKAQNLNHTLPALQKAFTENDIRSLDNDVFKSKYFKGMPITSDKLTNSAALAGYVSAARRDAKADFFAIGVAYITDNGVNPNTGKNIADGNVFIKVYSTVDSTVIAAGTFSESAFGNSPDQARAKVAEKIGQELGDELSTQIQNYWNKRTMYGQEYVIKISGNFAPVDRALLSRALKSAEGVENVTLRTSTDTSVEYTINYSGSDPAADSIFVQLYDANPARFGKYNFKTDGNQIRFYQMK